MKKVEKQTGEQTMTNSDVLERAANVAELLVEQAMFKRHVWRTDENGDQYYSDEAQELFNHYYSEALKEIDNGQ